MRSDLKSSELSMHVAKHVNSKIATYIIVFGNNMKAQLQYNIRKRKQKSF